MTVGPDLNRVCQSSDQSYHIYTVAPRRISFNSGQCLSLSCRRKWVRVPVGSYQRPSNDHTHTRLRPSNDHAQTRVVHQMATPTPIPSINCPRPYPVRPSNDHAHTQSVHQMTTPIPCPSIK